MAVASPSPLVLSHRMALRRRTVLAPRAQARQLLRAERGAPVNLARGVARRPRTHPGGPNEYPHRSFLLGQGGSTQCVRVPQEPFRSESLGTALVIYHGPSSLGDDDVDRPRSRTGWTWSLTASTSLWKGPSSTSAPRRLPDSVEELVGAPLASARVPAAASRPPRPPRERRPEALIQVGAPILVSHRAPGRAR